MEQLYYFDRLLGSGSGGKVFKVVHRTSGEVFAVKDIHAERIPGYKEYEILKSLSHPNIPKCVGSMSEAKKMFLIIEFIDGVPLSCLIDQDVKFTKYELAYLANEILNGLTYLHAAGVIHRDIKSNNIMLDRFSARAKIIDFDLSVQAVCTNEIKGTSCWMAPEVIMGEQYDGRADVWSLGITMYECVECYPLYMDLSSYYAKCEILDKGCPLPYGWDKDFKAFVTVCTTRSMNERPTSEQLLKHPFLLHAHLGDLYMYIYNWKPSQ